MNNLTSNHRSSDNVVVLAVEVSPLTKVWMAVSTALAAHAEVNVCMDIASVGSIAMHVYILPGGMMLT